MTSQIEVKHTELTQLHNAMLFTGITKISAIAFGEIIKVEVKCRTAEDLFKLGRVLETMPRDKKLDQQEEEEEKEVKTSTEKESKK